MRSQVAATALATVLLGFLMAQGITAPIWLLLGMSALVCYVLIASGRILLRVLDAPDLPIAAAWPLGVTVTSLVLYAFLTLLPLSLPWAFAFWAALVVTTDVLISMRSKPEPALDRVDLVGFALCLAVTAAWCRHTAAAPSVLAQHGFLPAWIDYFVHGGTISYFGDPRAADGGSIWLSGFPVHFYHYASYMIPASLAVPLDQPGLPLATSAWLPIGFLSLAAAAYALGTSLAGSVGGVAALAALFLIPDASNYGLRNGFFGFHWNLLTYPGSTYALGSALLATVFLHRWTATRMKTAIATSALLVAATILLRVHVFLLLFPAWLATVAIASQSVQRRRWIAWTIAALAATAVYLVVAETPLFGWWQDGAALDRFLYNVHSYQEPTGYSGLYRSIVSDYGEGVGFTAGVLLVFPACLGAFALLYPVAIFLQRERMQLRGVDTFPLALFVSYIALMMFAPAPAHGDSTEFTHRPFVLLYAVVAIWTIALLVRWLSAQGAHGPTRVWQTLMTATALALPMIWVGAADMARTKPSWANRLAPHHVERGLIEAAAFVRERSKPGDTMARLGPEAGHAVYDDSTVFVALSATPAYVAHPFFYISEGGARWKLAYSRYEALNGVSRERDAEAALSRLRDLGLRWYIVNAPGAPLWDLARAKAAYNHGNVAVYEVFPNPVP